MDWPKDKWTFCGVMRKYLAEMVKPYFKLLYKTVTQIIKHINLLKIKTQANTR